MAIYLIRHTTVAIEPGVCYGHTDVPVAESFEDEASLVQGKLPQLDQYTVYSSSLSRCLLLAERLAAGPIKIDSRLMEMSFGDWEMQRWDELIGEQLDAWMADFVHQRCAGGESYQELFIRVVDFWEELALRDLRDILIVTHGGVIRALLAYLLELPLENVFRIGIDFGGIVKIYQGDYTPVIEYINR